jgi:basic amino acid/polyamine antiporter, APA family
MKKSSVLTTPKPWFSVYSSVAVVIGIVVGVGIFRLPPLVAMHSPNEIYYILFWVAGGVISLSGALCYAELSSSMPDAGGEYSFLRKAYGNAMGFLLSWGRMTVIQTGSIALIAFILGDFASLLLNLGTYSTTIYALIAIVLLTIMNIAGTAYSGRAQNILTSIIVLSIIPLGLFGLFHHSEVSAFETYFSGNYDSLNFGAIGMAMIFVLLTYGGWSEAAYISGEVHNAKKNMVKTLVWGIVIITLMYVLINLAYLKVLGFETLKQSDAAGYALTEKLFGTNASVIFVLIIIVAALSTANATIITGARTNYALGRDFKALKFLGKWRKSTNSPVNALVFQAAIAIILVVTGTFAQQAIQVMVDYTAPVFWFFIILTTFSLFVFRARKTFANNHFKVPLYPLTPIIFIMASLYMLFSSITYAGNGAFIGLLILSAGVPVFFVINIKKIKK